MIPGADIDIAALSSLPDVSYAVAPPVETMARGGWKTGSPPGQAIRRAIPAPYGTGQGLVNNPAPIESIWHHEVFALIGRNMFVNRRDIPVQFLQEYPGPLPISEQPTLSTGDVWRDSMPQIFGK